jgi:MFS family permease
MFFDLLSPTGLAAKESNVNWDLYLRLSALMFLEFAIWGAWMPVLAVRLLGPLKMSGKQTGWIYATLPLASIFSPLVAGYMADKWFHAEHIILAAHAIGAVLLFLAAKQTRFGGMFLTMLGYSICYTATIPLVVKMLFAQLPTEATAVFFWAPVSWALIGYFLTGMRQVRKTGGDGPDCLYLAAVLSLVMVVVCIFQHPAKPTAEATTNPLTAALGMLSNSNYLIFMVVQLFVSGMQQFYFLGTGQFMQDRGINGKNISAAMGIAQAVQAAATILLLGWLIKNWGYQWTFVIGATCWSVLFLTYILSKNSLSVVIIQAFHGLAYVFFIIGGQDFVGNTAPASILASAQSLLAIATTGIGLFVGTQLAGMMMERNSIGGKFQWNKIWAVPLGITLAGAIAFAVLFKAPDKSEFTPDNAKQAAAAAEANNK